MNVGAVLKQVAEFLEENEGKRAEDLLKNTIKDAENVGDDESKLKLLNNLLTIYTDYSKVEEAYETANVILRQLDEMELEEGVTFANSILCVANAYRMGGKIEEALTFYEKVRAEYKKYLPADDKANAELENDSGILYQEINDLQTANLCFLRALAIVEHKASPLILAKTYVNLAENYSRQGMEKECFSYASYASKLYESMEIYDADYARAQAFMANFEYAKGNFEEAESVYNNALEIIERKLGKTKVYERLCENRNACRRQSANERISSDEKEKELLESELVPKNLTGLQICRAYYEEFGRPMIENSFSDFQDKIAVGLAGKGSDCFGFDDALSRDHDWGPGFCMWVTDDTYAAIGEELQKAYDRLPTEYMGYKRSKTLFGFDRRGVIRLSEYFDKFIQTADYDKIKWEFVEDTRLAEMVNGAIFRDDEKILTSMREKLIKGFPEEIKLMKIAEAGARFSQCGQYNFKRVCARGDMLTARMMLTDALREGMKLIHYIEDKYPPHDKWLLTSVKRIPQTEILSNALEEIANSNILEEEGQRTAIDAFDRIGEIISTRLYKENYVSFIDSYLDLHTKELNTKASLFAMTKDEIIEKLIGFMFTAYEKTQSEDSRSYCQDDWSTFKNMQISLLKTWPEEMLMQYYYDFKKELESGRNLVTEKYGRMLETTIPEDYKLIKETFPLISEEKKEIIEKIVKCNVEWLEEFAEKYPNIAKASRTIHTDTDTKYNTSFETYIRGEISTYSDKMLEMADAFIAKYYEDGENLCTQMLLNFVKMQGYDDLEDADKNY